MKARVKHLNMALGASAAVGLIAFLALSISTNSSSDSRTGVHGFLEKFKPAKPIQNEATVSLIHKERSSSSNSSEPALTESAITSSDAESTDTDKSPSKIASTQPDGISVSAEEETAEESKPIQVVRVGLDQVKPETENTEKKTSPMLEKVKSILPELGQRFSVYVASHSEYALTQNDEGYTLILPDGTAHTFAQNENDSTIKTPAGTECQFIAGNEEYSLGKMTDEAFILVTESGEEYTLALSMNVDPDSPEEPLSTEPTLAMQTLNAIEQEGENNYDKYVSNDEQYALTIDMSELDNPAHTLITEDGSVYNFHAFDDDNVLSVPSGTECAAVASGDGLALGSLSDDAYVLVRWSQDTEEPVYEEHTLFVMSGGAGGSMITSGSTLPGTTAEASDAGSTSATTSAGDSSSEASETDSGGIQSVMSEIAAASNPEAPASEVQEVAQSDIIADDFTDMPLYAMSMAERRIARRQRYAGLRVD